MLKEKLLFEQLISNSDAYAICRTIIQPEHFPMEIQSAVRFVLDHSAKYKEIPTPIMIKAETGVEVDKHDDVMTAGRTDWIINEIESYCRIQQVITAITDAADMIAEGNVDGIIQPIKEAVLLSTNRDLGLNYFENPKERLQDMLSKQSVEPIGFETLDDYLYGGIEKGELNIVAANSGKGKSFFMQNVALNWVFRGMNVLYVTLELSQNLVAKRIDSMVSGVNARDIFTEIDNVSNSVSMAKIKNGCGDFVIKYLSAQSTVMDIEAYVAEYRIRTNKDFDLVVVDYIDLLSPSTRGISLSDQFLKDKYVCEELRNFFLENGFYGLSASQLNRSGIEAETETGEHTQANIAGGISKINTAGNIFTLMCDKNMKENGLIKVQLLKTRSSAGEGKYCYLSVNPVTVRYTEGPSDAEKKATMGRPNKITEAIKGGSTRPNSSQSMKDRLAEIRKKGKPPS